jgi:hypothetical protein
MIGAGPDPALGPTSPRARAMGFARAQPIQTRVNALLAGSHLGMTALDWCCWCQKPSQRHRMLCPGHGTRIMDRL